MTYERKISSNMLERKKRAFDMELKKLDDSGRFAGYASVFHMVDSQQDILLPGAFAAGLQDGTSDVKLLWQHKSDEPIGVFEHIFEDQHGLYVEGRLLLNVQRAKEAYSLLKNGALKGLSIGYSPLKYTIAPETGTRILSEVRLWEISLVTFPANAAANVTVVKQEKTSTERYVPEDLVNLSDALDSAINALRI